MLDTSHQVGSERYGAPALTSYLEGWRPLLEQAFEGRPQALVTCLGKS